MATNSQPASVRLRASLRLVREMRTVGQASARQFEQLEKSLGSIAGDIERMEIASGTAPISAQLKAAGGNIVALKAVLDMDRIRKAVRHG